MADYTPSQSIDHLIEDLKDWRGKRLSRLRKLILEAAPDLTEDWKWETPVWVFNGNVVACGVFKDHVKVNFFKARRIFSQPPLWVKRRGATGGGNSIVDAGGGEYHDPCHRI